MSEFYDRVRDSAVISNLKQAEARIRDLEERHWEHQNKVDLISRLKGITSHVLGRLTVPDRGLVAMATLDELQNPSQQFLNSIEQIGTLELDVESDHTSINRSADELLRSASTLPAWPFRATSAVFEKAAEQFDRESQSATKLLSESTSPLLVQIEEVRKQLQTVSEQADAILAQTEQKVAEQITQSEATTNSLTTQAQRATERLERDVSNIQEVFRNSQAEHADEFKESQERREREYHERLDSTVAEIEDQRNQAKGMLEEVAGASTAEHYAKQRDTQKATADFWRMFGVGALLALVIAGGWIFYDASSTAMDFSVVWLIARSGLVVSLGLSATYALRQSGQHRRREEEMSRVSNELMLLWPFMNRLPDEDRKSLLLEITPLYFKGGLSLDNAMDEARWAEGAKNRLIPRPLRRTGE